MFSFSQIKNRFISWHEASEKIVSMNSRNLEYVYPSNKRKYYQIADNKLRTKEALKPLGFGLCETYHTYSYFYELKELAQHLRSLTSFVLKPAQGSGGNGIIVVVDKKEGFFITASGKKLSLDDIRSHIGNIIFGVFAQGLSDTAIIEERLIGHEALTVFNTLGLSDIRLICYHGKPIQAMMRIATEASDGKANLHQGGIGVSIDLQTGQTLYAQVFREDISIHPETGVELLGVIIPLWDEVMQLALEVSEALPLKYLGIDIAIGYMGPVVLEVNARPGIEIQNINHQGMKPLLKGCLV